MGKWFERYAIALAIGVFLVVFSIQDRNSSILVGVIPLALGYIALALLAASWLSLRYSKLWQIQGLGYQVGVCPRGGYSLIKEGHPSIAGFSTLSEALEEVKRREHEELIRRGDLAEQEFNSRRVSGSEG